MGLCSSGTPVSLDRVILRLIGEGLGPGGRLDVIAPIRPCAEHNQFSL
jgi:hypothetical protein